MNNNEKFQELVRIVDATSGNYNRDALVTGWNAMHFIKQQYETTMLKDFVSPEFHTLIGEEIEKSTEKANVREHVKRVLMYPNYDYSPWESYPLSREIKDKISDATSKVSFNFELRHGKVYAVSKNDNLVSSVYNILVGEDSIFKELEPNTEGCHITLVNSNIVHDIGTKEVEQFLSENKTDDFSIKTGNVNTTVSRDWSRFSRCYVIEVQSDRINDFLTKFNEEFDRSIKPSPHVTFAIQSRDLFHKMLL